jgi:hypothetical protein
MAAMLHYLRIAVTVLSLTACVLLISLWVRSYWFRDRVEGRLSQSALFNAWSMEGQLTCLVTDGQGHWKISSSPVLDLQLPLSAMFKVGWNNNLDSVVVYCPHWCLVVIFATLSAVPWIHWSQRFSIRTLLIATTLVAVGLGIVAVIN